MGERQTWENVELTNPKTGKTSSVHWLRIILLICSSGSFLGTRMILLICSGALRWRQSNDIVNLFASGSPMILLICSPRMVEKCSPLDDIVNSFGRLFCQSGVRKHTGITDPTFPKCLFLSIQWFTKYRQSVQANFENVVLANRELTLAAE